MSNIILSDKHIPCGYMGILGCNGYEVSDKIICLTANGDDNFLNEGIVEGSILFVDTNGKYEEGLLNVFKYRSNISPQYKLSRNKVARSILCRQGAYGDKPILIGVQNNGKPKESICRGTGKTPD